jgi:hypothetical protein
MRPIRWSLGGVLALFLSAAAADPAQDPAATPELKLSGPYSHENLTIFLIHGKDPLPGKKFLTLEEALQQKKLVVHETGNVQQLAVENVSMDTEVFIQAGDIVKGGQQDRVVRCDLIVSAKSGKVPLLSFCVESGRWQKRGSEEASMFGFSGNCCNCRGARLAVQGAGEQSKVWEKVREVQNKLARSVGGSVKSKDSPTSLQLTLEDKKILENLDTYTRELGKIVAGQKDAIGYVVVINGSVELADIYMNADFLAKVWPRLLNGSAVDALSQVKKDMQFEPATAETVRKFLAETENAKNERKKDVSKRIQVRTKEGDKMLFVESCDRDNGNLAIRRSYIAVSPTSLATLTAAERRKLAEAVATLTPEDRKLAEAQMFCAINHDSPLGSQGKIRKVMCNKKPVFVCCGGCADDAENYPDDALAMLEKLQAKLKAKK